MLTTTLALTNATGRQSASLARAASAVGYHVSAHIASAAYSPLVARELSELPNITIHEGPLSSPDIRAALFENADIAFINTTTFDDETVDGQACIDKAKELGLLHIVYSSMLDHSVVEGEGWTGLPHWRPKWKVEEYARSLGVPATFVHTGIYHNNFTSLPYPLFCLKEVPWEEVMKWDGDWEDDWVPENDGTETKGRKCGFEWQAPFPADVKLPWLDCEHDFGPAVLQIFKQGPKKWAGRRIPLAFSMLDPPSVCAAFSRGLNRPVRFIEAPVEIKVPVPQGYRGQLEALQGLLGGDAVKGKRAPYWWAGMFDVGPSDPSNEDEEDDEVIGEEDEGEEILCVPRKLWGGWRTLEGYAREVFPVEEKLNGMTWMK